MAKRDAKGRFKKKANGGDFWTPISGSTFGGGQSYDVYGANGMPTPTDLLMAYSTVDIVNSCVNLIANHMAAFAPRIKLHATTEQGQPRPQSRTRRLETQYRKGLELNFRKHVRKAVNVEEVVDHPLLDLLENPNPSQSLGKLLSLTSLFLDVVGSAFWYLARPELNGHKLDTVGEIWILPPQQIQIDIDNKTGEVIGYIQNAVEKEVYYKPEDIIHFKYDSPFDTYTGFGISPLLACWQAVQLLRQEQTSWQAILSNMAYPSMLITPKDENTLVSEQNAERYQKELGNIFRQGNQGGPLFVMDALTITPLAPPPKDLSALQLYDQLRTRFCSTYHVPMPLLDQSGTTGEAVNTSRRLLQENCLKPRIVNILDTITQKLCRDRLFLATDQIIEPDFQFELQRTSALYQAGLLTQNEARGTQGKDPIAGGDRMIFEVMGGGQGNSGIGTLPSFQGKRLEPKKKAFVQPDPTALVDALVEVFRKLAKETMTKFGQTYEAKAFIPVAEWTKELAETLTPILRIYYEAGSDELLGKLGGDDSLRKLTNHNLDKVVREAALALADSTLNTTTLEVEAAIAELRKQLDEGISQGEANLRLAERVNSIFTELTTRRAYLIAETESARAKQAGELIAIQDSGIEAKKVWLADNMACDFCKSLDGSSKDLDEPFAVRGTGPYSVIQHPPYHPACLLGETPVVVTGAISSAKSWYDGPCLRVVTANGNDFTCTPNHMLLTPAGFVRAADLVKGDNVVYCPVGKGVLTVNPNDDRKPTRIDEVVSSLAEAPGVSTYAVPSAPEYLHGDGRSCKGNIDVVTTDGFGRDERNIEFGENVTEQGFGIGAVGTVPLDSGSDLDSVLFALCRATDGGMSGIRERHSLVTGGFRHSEEHGITPIAGLDSGFVQAAADDGSGNSETLRKCLFGFAGKVSTDEIINIESVTHSGWVYDLETKSTLYLIGNGVVSSNCRCTMTYDMGV